MRDRHSRVLVNGELSEAYYIEDGIDQGEAWSPIIIMENVLQSIINKQRRKNTTMYNAIAFMEDTTLIAKDENLIKYLLDICHSFYKMCDIKANVKKYELIRINNPDGDHKYFKIYENRITKIQ
ncbi:hypothetical protein GLOIN_2v1790647 [Rhizophagus irregularis DAOM 181602=DAOM 197198]|nr:hypothetical protein GLOIN_2v1790647 [Rhizophagus irregularis DAOM 181602=DAOM 197198]